MLAGSHCALPCSHVIHEPPQARLEVDSLPHDCQGGHGVDQGQGDPCVVGGLAPPIQVPKVPCRQAGAPAWWRQAGGASTAPFSSSGCLWRQVQECSLMCRVPSGDTGRVQGKHACCELHLAHAVHSACAQM